jgi:hypothetical protein
MFLNLLTLIFTAQNDQCATAAEIFQCSQKKDIAFTNALIQDNKGAAQVCSDWQFKSFLFSFLISFQHL